MWREYYAVSFDFVGADVLAAASQRDPVSAVYASLMVRMDAGADFELVKTSFVATDDRVFLRLRDDSTGRHLERGTQLLNLTGGRARVIAGTVTDSPDFRPFIWPVPYVIAASAVLECLAADFSNGANTVRITIHGNKLQPGIAPYYDGAGVRSKYRHRVPAFLMLESGSLAANATFTGLIQLDRDADFLVRKLVAMRTGTATLAFADAGSRDKHWQDRAMHIDNCCGNGSVPHVLSSPRWLERGSGILVTMSDLSGVTNRISLGVIGEKLYV